MRMLQAENMYVMGVRSEEVRIIVQRALRDIRSREVADQAKLGHRTVPESVAGLGTLQPGLRRPLPAGVGKPAESVGELIDEQEKATGEA